MCVKYVGGPGNCLYLKIVTKKSRQKKSLLRD